MSSPLSGSPPAGDPVDPRTVVWIDPQKARLFVSSAGNRLTKSDVVSDRRSGRASGNNARYSGDDNKYLDAVMAAIPATGDILIIGPAGAVKTEFMAYLSRKGPEIAARIRGVEDSTATSDGQLLARAKAFFLADRDAGRPER
jgi:hypothetical protein